MRTADSRSRYSATSYRFSLASFIVRSTLGCTVYVVYDVGTYVAFHNALLHEIFGCCAMNTFNSLTIREVNLPIHIQ